ncbi:hypothetical protein [Hyphomicrobium sp.]|uniref:hypothetical protein n=1 Tax=Hyphomicrobium sp. TaxID=82 RepID=UPI002CA25351|nr:hypothetical protein [Hyphomicrobium sp.]HRN89606.1 hypothetical protein [Hyphomicrobium sp.]HRQ28226.1 hypothetical protein [Hyphomicrobium sp.]
MAAPAQIVVLRTGADDPFKFLVEVRDADGQSQYDVTLQHDTYRRISGEKFAPETCVEAAFRFLLDREPKQSILSSFDIDQISQYFPEIERTLPKYLPRL